MKTIFVCCINANYLNKKNLFESFDHSREFFKCRAYMYHGDITEESLELDKSKKFLKQSYCARYYGVFDSNTSIFCPENTLDKFYELVSNSFDEPCVEMTIEQICKAIGKNVKIVR